MAIAEVNALYQILREASNAVLRIRMNYKLASDSIKSFPQKVTQFERKKSDWQRLLKKFPLQADSDVQIRLEKAVELLRQGIDEFEGLQHKSCCLWWKKLTSAEQLECRVRDVNNAFEEISRSLVERLENERLAEAATTQIKAPFDFFEDEKYVPITGTMTKIQMALEDDDGSNGNIVLLHGGSGEGKTSLVKYLALHYYKESKKASILCNNATPNTSTSSNWRRFSDGVIYIHCGKGANSLSLLQKLWEDLGYRAAESHTEELLDDEIQELTSSSQRRHVQREVENIRRKLIERMPLLTSLLVIVDDVWHQKVIQDILIPVDPRATHQIKYLITSQDERVWRDGVTFVPMGKPTANEARQILAGHIVDTGLVSRRFSTEVQEEIDHLVEKVDRNPLVLATLASVVSSTDNLQKWRALMQGLIDVLKIQDTRPNPVVFGKSYERKVVASLTMAFESLTPGARTILLLLVICSSDGVDESVLKLCFKTLHGQSTAFEFTFGLFSRDLAARSFISVRSQQIHWREEPWTIWKIHEMRQLLIREMKQEAVTEIIRKLTEADNVSKERVEGTYTDKDLVIALCFLYGDVSCSAVAGKILTKSIGLQGKTMHRNWLRSCSKAFVTLLYPDCRETWEETTHELGKKVILHMLKFQELDDDAVSRLLKIPEAASNTCSALVLMHKRSGYKSFRAHLPKSVNELVNSIGQYVEKDPQHYQDLKVHVEALAICVRMRSWLSITDLDTFPITCDLFRLVWKFLQWPWHERALADDHSVPIQLMRILYYSSRRQRDVEAAVHVSGLEITPQRLLEMLLGFSDVKFKSSPILQQEAARAFQVFACKDEDLKTKTMGLPNLLEILTSLLPHTPTAAHILKELASNQWSADIIASQAGVLNGLVGLLSQNSQASAQDAALSCLVQLASTRQNWRRISTCDGALQQLVRLLHEDAPQAILARIAKFVQAITCNCDGPELGDQNIQKFLVEVLEKCNLLQGGNGGVKSNLLEYVSKFFQKLSSGGTDAEESMKMKLLKTCVAPLALAREKGEKSEKGELEKAAVVRALGILAMVQAYRELMVVEFQEALDLLIGLLIEPTKSSILISVCDAVQFISSSGVDPQDLDQRTKNFRARIMLGYMVLLESKQDSRNRRRIQCAAESLSNLLAYKGNRDLLAATCPEASSKLQRFLTHQDGSERSFGDSRMWGAVTLTLINPEEAETLDASFANTLRGRGKAKASQHSYESALVDYDRAVELQPSWPYLLSERAFIRAQLMNYQLAHQDLEHAFKVHSGNPDRFIWQEMGILKRMMGNYGGALSDLNQSHRSSKSDDQEGWKLQHSETGPYGRSLSSGRWDDYEVLKHRGLVKFLMGDEDGARLDAKQALLSKSARIDLPLYAGGQYFGAQPVKFLEYELR